jgi:hypothetical protein
MTSTSETGHAKNVANLETLIAFCTGYGIAYNPAKANLKVAALKTLQTNSLTAIASIIPPSVVYHNAVNARTIAFAGLQKLSTRLINALDATAASPQTVTNAKSINKKLQGSKRPSKATEAPATSPDPNAPVVESAKTISTSQQSYSSLVEHFSALIAILNAEIEYKPNETELKVLALNTLLAQLKTTNTAVINAYTLISNARLARNQVLYNDTAGLIVTAKEVKMYVKSLYGATSPQYKQISSLIFKAVTI